MPSSSRHQNDPENQERQTQHHHRSKQYQIAFRHSLAKIERRWQYVLMRSVSSLPGKCQEGCGIYGKYRVIASNIFVELADEEPAGWFYPALLIRILAQTCLQQNHLLLAHLARFLI